MSDEGLEFLAPWNQDVISEIERREASTNE